VIPTPPTEVFEFRAQTRDLLALVIHSLYTNKEIFLRELVSNASDALDRLRFEGLLVPTLVPADHVPLITLEADPVDRTLTISDNGIGMTRDHVVANIGTIARSGTRELVEQLRARGNESVPDLVGRFGVGFYSAFMAASHVSLVTRYAGESTATRWESSGAGEYAVSEAERATCGTSVTLKLKAADPEGGLDDYADPWVLTRLVHRYSDFVSYPIVLKNAPGDESAISEAAAAAPVDRVLNSQKPVWANPEASDEDYAACYRHLSHDWQPPLLRVLARAEGRIECQALLFVPAVAPSDLYYHASPFGLQLYAKRVLVLERCPDLLPRYLRFVKGVVDVLDLPLHISRETLQERILIDRIRTWITRKVIDLLASTREHDPATFLKVWRQFGRVMKEGLGSDHENRDRLLRLFLFESSHHSTELTTLDEYVARCAEGQQHIFYLTGESRESIERAPHLEAVRDSGLEVLFLADPVDELVVQALPEYGGKRLKALNKGTLDLARGAQPDDPPPPVDLSALTSRLQSLLTERVRNVRVSTRLTESAVCLTREEYDESPQMERLLLRGRGAGPRSRPTLELNPRHPLITRLSERLASGDEATPWEDCAELLVGSALLAEGSEPLNPVAFGRAVTRLMQRGLC